jgi:hypothetical protein
VTAKWLAGIAVAALGLSGVALMERREAAPASRPKLALLTSLPLQFSESFGLEPPRSDTLARVRRDFDIVPIAVADRASLNGQRLLLMAHPRAQPADMLVELDQWVRGGGRVVLLADPRLDWDSSRPLGDRLRPPPDFADTGLLVHWGLRLGVDAAGEGELRATGGNCRVGEQALVARCRLGRGRATVIADADFIMGEGGNAARRLDLMVGELRGLGAR